jgi:hypothetical protein
VGTLLQARPIAVRLLTLNLLELHVGFPQVGPLLVARPTARTATVVGMQLGSNL